MKRILAYEVPVLTGGNMTDAILTLGGGILLFVLLMVTVGLAVIAALFTGLAIRYTIRRLRGYFSERARRHAHG